MLSNKAPKEEEVTSGYEEAFMYSVVETTMFTTLLLRGEL
jgi:hypothetical protein